MTTKEEKQIQRHDGDKYLEVTYVYDSTKGGHPLEVKKRVLTPEETAIENQKRLDERALLKQETNNRVTLAKLDQKLDLILTKLNR